MFACSRVCRSQCSAPSEPSDPPKHPSTTECRHFSQPKHDLGQINNVWHLSGHRWPHAGLRAWGASAHHRPLKPCGHHTCAALRYSGCNWGLLPAAGRHEVLSASTAHPHPVWACMHAPHAPFKTASFHVTTLCDTLLPGHTFLIDHFPPKIDSALG